MPIIEGSNYVKWGRHGKKYYFYTAKGKLIARARALNQMKAIKRRES